MGEPDTGGVGATAVALGRHLSAERVARVLDLDLAGARRALAAALADGTLDVEDGHVVVAGSPPPPPAEVTQRVVRVLVQDGLVGDRLDALLPMTPPSGDPWVVEQLVTAAAHDLGRGAYETAVARLERALAEPPDDDARTRIEAMLTVTRGHLGRPLGDPRLEDAVEREQDPVARARLCAVTAITRYGDPHVCVPMVRRGLADLAAHDALDEDPDLHALLLAGLTGRAPTPRNADHAPTADEQAAIEAYCADTPTGGGRAALQLARACTAAWGTALPREQLVSTVWSAAEVAEAAAARSIQEPVHTHLLYGVGALVACGVGEAPVVAERIASLGRGLGGPAATIAAAHARSMIAFDRRDRHTLEANTRLLGDGLELLRVRGPARRAWAAFRARAHLLAGDTDAAVAVLDSGHARGGRDAGDLMWIDRVLVDLARDMGASHTDMVDHWERYGARVAEAGFTNPVTHGWRHELARHLGATGDGREEGRRARAEADAWGAPVAMARARTATAATVPPDEGLALVQEARDLLADGPWEYDALEADLAWATLAGRAGNRDVARVLAHVVDRSEALGLTVLAARARALAHGLGTEVGWRALTPRQRTVARYLHAGASNREIAEALFVSIRTVESHVAAVLRRLGVGSRTEVGGLDLPDH